MNNKQEIFLKEIIEKINCNNQSLIELLRSSNLLSKLIKILIIDNFDDCPELPKHISEKQILEFFNVNKINNKYSLKKYLNSKSISLSELKNQVCSPIKKQYLALREFSNRAEDIFLKNKNLFYQVNFVSITSKKENILLELFFQLKNKENLYENIIKNQYLDDKNDIKYTSQGPILLFDVDKNLRNLLINLALGEIHQPTKINNIFYLLQLNEKKQIYFDDKLKVYLSTILFDDWLEITTEKIIKILLSNK